MKKHVACGTSQRLRRDNISKAHGRTLGVVKLHHKLMSKRCVTRTSGFSIISEIFVLFDFLVTGRTYVT